MVALIAVAWTWTVVRFCGLEVSPPGFFMDEATPAVHAMCLAETGKDGDGNAWPLYSRAAGGGHHPLTLLAFDIIWTRLFGTSRGAFRAVSAFWVLLTSLGLVLLAREIAHLLAIAPDDRSTRRAAAAFPWLVGLAALLSPWSFQFSRVAWEAPLAPAFMVLSLWATLRGTRIGVGPTYPVTAGACAAAAMITYPPLRATMPLVLAGTGLLLFLRASNRQARMRLLRLAGVLALVAGALMARTMRMLGQGSINERMNNIAIWRRDWLADHAGSVPHWRFLTGTFLDNLLLHLRPSFLLLDGDATMRHSPRLTGMLSVVDILALGLIAGLVLIVVTQYLRGRPSPQLVSDPDQAATLRRFLAVALCAGLGWICGLVPAALTYDALPHALRAIAAWPFVALFTGAVLAWAWSRASELPALLALLSFAYTIYFLPAYFHAYDKEMNHWFMRDMSDVLEKESRAKPPKTPAQIIEDHFAYSYYYDEVPRYYLMTYGKLSCEDAARKVHELRRREQEQGR
ncbi:MAG: hypothetical protein ABSB49_20055 [Polyangia bacterium]|jgi:hypothetical protein